jgi:hypothetical protein
MRRAATSTEKRPQICLRSRCPRVSIRSTSARPARITKATISRLSISSNSSRKSPGYRKVFKRSVFFAISVGCPPLESSQIAIVRNPPMIHVKPDRRLLEPSIHPAWIPNRCHPDARRQHPDPEMWVPAACLAQCSAGLPMLSPIQGFWTMSALRMHIIVGRIPNHSCRAASPIDARPFSDSQRHRPCCKTSNLPLPPLSVEWNREIEQKNLKSLFVLFVLEISMIFDFTTS